MPGFKGIFISSFLSMKAASFNFNWITIKIDFLNLEWKCIRTYL